MTGDVSVRAPYGGRVVKWVAFMVLFLQRGGGTADVVAVGGAVRASAGVATVVSLIFGGWVPQDLGFVARPLSILERGRRGGLLMGTPRTGVRDAGEARAASPAATDVDRGGQSEALILLVVVDLGFCGTEEACVRGSPAGTDAGGMGSGWVVQVAISQQ